MIAWRNRRDRQQPVRLPAPLVMLVVFQGLLGMLTVTLLVKPLIVVGAPGRRPHDDVAAVVAVAADARRTTRPRGERGLRRWAVVALVVLALQILLGGWTSSNYAAISCPDFPTCQASCWPDMDYDDAFVLWRGLGINYNGGVLEHPARVAIHFTHRLGAILAALVLGFVAGWPLRAAQSRGCAWPAPPSPRCACCAAGSSAC